MLKDSIIVNAVKNNLQLIVDNVFDVKNLINQ